MENSDIFNDDGLNEQTWLYYENEKTKHLKFNIEEWLRTDTVESVETKGYQNKLTIKDNDSGTKDKENIPITFQPSPMKISDPKCIQDAEKIKILTSYGWNFTMDGADMNRTLLEDVKLSFDNSLEYYSINNYNGRNDEEILSEYSPMNADTDNHFHPETVSTPEVNIQRSKLKKGVLETPNYNQKQRLPVESLSDHGIQNQNHEVLNDTFVHPKDDLAVEGINDSKIEPCSPILGEKSINFSTKSTPESGIGKTIPKLKSLNQMRDNYRKQSLESLKDQIYEEPNIILNTTFALSDGSLNHEDLERVENEVNKTFLMSNEKIADAPSLSHLHLDSKDKRLSQDSNSGTYVLNETFTQNPTDVIEANNKQRYSIENGDKFSNADGLLDNQGSYTSEGILHSNENCNIRPCNTFPLKTVKSGNVIETVVAGTSAPVVNKKAPKKLGSRLPMPVNRSTLSRTRISAVHSKNRIN